jgi:hypothetical protein
MKSGKTLSELWATLKEQDKNKLDFLAESKALHYETDKDGVSVLTCDIDGEKRMPVSRLAQRQIADRLKIPAKYFDLMRTEYPDLLDTNVNGWLQKVNDRRMVRTMYGEVRAFLSDSYQRIDNVAIAERVLRVLNEKDGQFGTDCWKMESCEVTETKMYIKILSERLTDEVTVGDRVQAGFVVSNSEVGLGCVKIEPLIYRLVCTNGMILPERTHKKYHAGSRIQLEDNISIDVFRDETLKMSDSAYLMKVEDILRNALDEQVFRDTVLRMRKAKMQTIEADHVETVKVLGKAYNLTEQETWQVGINYGNDGDYTHYGLANAVTKTANTASSYDRATELERMGGVILNNDIDSLIRSIELRKSIA